MKNKACVIMLVKSAERGMVKSRLATSVGEDIALDLYKCFVSDLMGTLTKGGYYHKIFFYPPDSRQRVVQWLGDEQTLIPQKGSNLGERMKNAFELVFSQGFQHVLLIGSDSPDLPNLLIDEALGALKDYDVVVGPSHDGGYYLIAFKRDTFLAQVFGGINWGTSEVFEQTIRILRKATLTVYTLPKWRDIDTVDDLKVLFLNSQNTPFAESTTIKYMETKRCDLFQIRGHSIMNDFEKRIAAQHETEGLFSDTIETLQVNLGLKCNQQCVHCHLECSPERNEMMEWPVMELVLKAADSSHCGRVDLTGGAPELNPFFRRFVKALREKGCLVQARTNLTILLDAGFDDLPGFFKEQGVQLVASLPCYTKENVCAQRGAGVFEKSIEAIRRLNRLGYGLEPSLTLSLVYNPGGAFLPSPQISLEGDYRRELAEGFGIAFTNLFTITNMPLGRFQKELLRQGQMGPYTRLLRESFNPATVSRLMCRRQLSIGWDGTLYDCDFNQALGLSVNHGAPDHIRSFAPDELRKRRIMTGDHCFGCTAGAGSSCGGSIVLL